MHACLKGLKKKKEEKEKMTLVKDQFVQKTF